MAADAEEFGAGYWERRYRAGEGTSRHDPSPSLIRETADMPPGRALDAGCGHGADAIRLAARGWHVTAVDVSATALQHARAGARAAGDDVAGRIDWVEADLTRWQPTDGRFELVTCSYVHVPGPVEDLFRRLASWVAPGGTLLVVGHDHAHDHHRPPGHRAPGPGPSGAPASRITAPQVTDALAPDDWDITVAESRTQSIRRPDAPGRVVLHDTVVRARHREPRGT